MVDCSGTFIAHVHVHVNDAWLVNSHIQGGGKQRSVAKGSVASFFTKKPSEGVFHCHMYNILISTLLKPANSLH